MKGTRPAARGPSSGGPAVFVASLALHAAVGIGIAAAPRRPVKRPVVVTIRQPPRPPVPAATPAPAAPAPAPVIAPVRATAPSRAAHTATPSHATPARAASAPAAAPSAPAGAADFGLTLSGSSGGNGVAAGSGGGGGGDGEKAPPPAPHPKADDGCSDALVRAKAIEVPQPEYPDSARESGVEGRVRVEIEVDERGAVREARVVTSLSPALDAAALEAARRGRFEPATRCGKPVASTFALGIRFEL